MKKQTYTLESLTLTNSDVFNKDVDITFDKKVTIIQSPNAGYKTTLFNAMRTGVWPYTGEFKFKFSGNLSVYDLLNFTYVDEEWLFYKFTEQHNSYSEINKSNLFKEIFLENIKKINDSLNFKRYDVYDLQDDADPFQAFSVPLAAGEKGLLLLAYWASIREYLGIDGAIILDGALAMMDIYIKHIALKMLTSMANQLVIFSHPAFVDLDDWLINLDQDDIKIIDLDPKF